MSGNIAFIVQDAQILATAVFDVYRTTAKEYERAIGPIVSPEQQKVVLDVALACVGIANKEQRVEKWREEKKNGNCHQPPKPKIISETKPAETTEKELVNPEQMGGVAQPDQPKPAPEPVPPPSPNGPRPPEDESERPKKSRDDRNRPVELLIKELNIKSPAHAGFLRLRKEISYREWQRVRDCLSMREIREGGAVPA